jgi:hypothetical protein
MRTCALPQLGLLSLPERAFHREVLMRGRSDVAHQVLVGEYLRAQREELGRGECGSSEICGLWRMRVVMGEMVGAVMRLREAVGGVALRFFFGLKSLLI